MTLLLRLEGLYLCPGDENGAHVTDSAVCCGCGNSNIVSLAKILDRPFVNETLIQNLKDQYQGICSDVPTIEKLFSN